MNKAILAIFLFLAFFGGNSYPAEESEYIKARCVIHVHSTVSSGYLSIEDYAWLAREKGAASVIITDNALYRYEYGLWPLRGVLKKVQEKNSILKYGPRNYLKSIEEANKKYKDVIIIDGAQVTPFYFWTGSIFNANLTLNNRNKDMLVIGLGDAEDYKDLPIVGGRHSKYDQYHGDKFNEPYQNLIDYVNQRGGLAFWSHPEIEENLKVMGVHLITIPYPYDLLATKGYMGFGIFAEGYKTIGKPLGLWDRILTEYCLGKRAKPIWAIGELEYGGEEEKTLVDTMNVLYVKKLSREDILDALKVGRFYVSTKASPKIHLSLDEFVLRDSVTGNSAMMGQTLICEGAPSVKIKLSHETFLDEWIIVKLIRHNQIVKEFSGTGTLEAEFVDEDVKPNESVYYRIDVEGQDLSRLISNPIFFRRAQSK